RFARLVGHAALAEAHDAGWPDEPGGTWGHVEHRGVRVLSPVPRHGALLRGGRAHVSHRDSPDLAAHLCDLGRETIAAPMTTPRSIGRGKQARSLAAAGMLLLIFS